MGRGAQGAPSKQQGLLAHVLVRHAAGMYRFTQAAPPNKLNPDVLIWLKGAAGWIPFVDHPLKLERYKED